jgi:hypothetical protein
MTSVVIDEINEVAADVGSALRATAIA